MVISFFIIIFKHQLKTKDIRIMKKYWIINVGGIDGYSLLVHCGAKTIEQAIDIAADADLFDSADDAKAAFGEEADDYTIKHFNEYGLTHEL